MTDTQTEAKPVRYRIRWKYYHHDNCGSWFSSGVKIRVESAIDQLNEIHGQGTHWLETDEQNNNEEN